MKPVRSALLHEERRAEETVVVVRSPPPPLAMDAPAATRALVPGRGFGLVASRDIAAGETVVRERAVLCGVSEAHRALACARCLATTARGTSSRPPPCPGCGQVLLCASGACARDALGHGPIACAAERLTANASAAERVDRERVRFLAACADLRRDAATAPPPTNPAADPLDARRRDAAERLAALDRLCPRADDPADGVPRRDVDAAARLRPTLERAVADATSAPDPRGVVGGPAGFAPAGFAPPSPLAAALASIVGSDAENARLLAKEARNAFGVMAAPEFASPTAEGEAASAASAYAASAVAERSVRGAGLYDLASAVNHACFPNVARFDNFDATFDDPENGFEARGGVFGGVNGGVYAPPDELRLVAVDRVARGEEIVMSYRPVGEPTARRRRGLRRAFGFACACARCALEVGWAREDGTSTGDEDARPRARAAATAATAVSAAAAAAARDHDDDDDDDAAQLAADEAMDASDASRLARVDAAESARRADRIPGEYAMWFARNECPDPRCGGTLAPPNPKAAHMMCNYCGRKRTDAEFFAALEAG